MTTLKDISKTLNLSITTVSRALNGYPEVNEETRALVMKTAKALNYQPNQFARQLVTGQSGLVGLVEPASSEPGKAPAFLEIITGLSQALAAHNRYFILHISTDPQVLMTYEQLVKRRILDGFVINAPTEQDPRIAYLTQHQIPFVVHGRCPDREDYAYYDINNYQVGYDLTTHLLQLGHRHIALLNGPSQMGFAQKRLQGYQEALAHYHVPTTPEYLYQHAMTAQYGYDSTKTLLKLPQRPSAWVCSNLLIADGVMTALKEAGLRIPEDVSVVAHDDDIRHWSTVAKDFLTVTYSPLADACQPLADLLVRRIAGESITQLRQVNAAPLQINHSTGEFKS